MSKILPNKLLISEMFMSIQGEGKTSGYPAYFLRLTNCNLTCGCSPSFVNQLKKEQIQFEPGHFAGDLELEGKATWSCDTTPVWLKGEYVEFKDLINKWNSERIYDHIKSGLIHIIWTGGEPTIKQHQESIINFYKFWRSIDLYSHTNFSEIETNGTVYINDELFNILDQINCSPKLSNSGMSVKQRIVPEAIKRIMQHSNYQFKFVLTNEDDIFEMFETYIKPFSIPLQNVCCMPGLVERENFHERTHFILEMAKKYKFIGLTRLHISGYDKATGV